MYTCLTLLRHQNKKGQRYPLSVLNLIESPLNNCVKILESSTDNFETILITSLDDDDVFW